MSGGLEWVEEAAGLRGSVPDFPQWGWRLIVARISAGSGGRAARSYWLIRTRAERGSDVTRPSPPGSVQRAARCGES